MKYLESFDLFGPGEYEKITRGNFHDITSKMKYEGVNEPERVRFERLFKKILNPANKDLDWPKVEIYKTDSSDYYYTSIDQDKIIFIFHYEDDWYFIEYYNQNSMDSHYYKCDGIDGVEKMLRENFSKFTK